MTQKHFVAIAEIFRGNLAVYLPQTPEALAIRADILSLADYFGRENPRFRRDLFYKACGLTGDGYFR